MPSIRNFKMTYDALNDYGTFSEGDTITGKVTLELEKDTKIESLFVKAKGDVSVHWSEKHGDNTRSYNAHRRLFKQKHFLIAEEHKDTILPSGVHVFKFTINLPLGGLPSSFRGSHGKVVYKLEAKLCRSWRMDRTDEKEIYFSSKSFPNIDQLMFPQTGSTNKEVGVFSKGTVQMDATVDRRGYAPGDTVTINAKINNSSSKDVTPKFSLIQDVVYRANGSTKYEKNVIHKEVGGCVKPQTNIEVRRVFKIPPGAPLSIHNCDILSVEYRIKAYLDISFSFDPEVVFPLVLYIGGFSSTATPSVSVSPYAAGGAIGGPSSSDFPPPASHYPPSPHSGAPMYPATSPQYPANPGLYAGAGTGAALYPVPPGHFAGGYHNPAPLQPNPYGSPFSSSSSSPVLHPPPSVSPTSRRSPSPGPPPPTFPSAPPTYNTLEPAGLNNTVPSPPSYPSAPFMPTLPSEMSVPSAPLVTDNFLSQSDDKPPSYEILFPTSGAK